jgi:hypothetical protein
MPTDPNKREVRSDVKDMRNWSMGERFDGEFPLLLLDFLVEKLTFALLVERNDDDVFVHSSLLVLSSSSSAMPLQCGI